MTLKKGGSFEESLNSGLGGKLYSTLALRIEKVLNAEPGKVQLCHALKLVP